MGVLPDQHQDRHRRKHRRQTHGHLHAHKPRNPDERQTFESPPEHKEPPAPRNSLRRHGELFVGHMNKMLRHKRNFKLSHRKNNGIENQGMFSEQEDSKRNNTEGDRVSVGKGALNKSAVNIKQHYEHLETSGSNSTKLSTPDLKSILSSVPVASKLSLDHGGGMIYAGPGGINNREDLNSKDHQWIQQDAPAGVAKSNNSNSSTTNIDKNNNPFNIPPPLAGHIPTLNTISSNSSDPSSLPFGETSVLSGISGSGTGISESSLGTPVSGGSLGLEMFLPPSGAVRTSMPQPGIDHRDKCGTVCMEGTVCVHLKHKSAWECICEGDFKPPHPETGCDPIPRATVDYDGSLGVISADGHQGIVQFNEKNFGTTNQTLSMLRQPTDTPQSSSHLPEVVIPVVSCVVVIFLLGVFACLYRRKRKLLYFKGKRDSILRNTDGAILLDNMNIITKNPTYYYQSATGGRRFNTRIVPAECLVLGQVAGEGAFGQVFKGEMTLPDSDVKTKVAVKILKEGASHEAQEDFEREVEIMSAFDHDNILKLLGIVTQGVEGNPYMIFEFMEHGDLTELLRRNDPCNRHVAAPRNGGQAVAPGQGQTMTLPTGQSSRPGISLSKADLVDISVQIANGMSYLASQHFVHRDLATRNCLVGAGLVVKISDFGMSRDIYTNDYYRIGGSRMLPVRWMSPEAIKYGRFTCESDIWAYGVVLWEIFSFGKQPYYGHSNEEVIHFLDQGILLQRPEDCPSTIYHVMIACWKRDPRQRIIFERLVKYLKDYASHLMSNQRQQQQQQQQHKQQKQKEQQQRQQQRLTQARQLQGKNGESPNRSCSSGSEITDLSDVPNTPDDTIGPDLTSTPPILSSRVLASMLEPQGDYRRGILDRRYTADTTNRVTPASLLLSSSTTKSDANVSSTVIKSSPSPRLFYHSHHHRSLTLPHNNSVSSRSLFKPNGFSFKAPSSPKFFRAFSSKKGRKAASYSTLTANGSRDSAKCGEDRTATNTKGRRRYSSGEASRFGSLKNLLHSKLSGSLQVDIPPCDKLSSTDSVGNCSSISSKSVGRDGVTGTLLMDRLNAGNKKTLATQNTYDTSLLRSRGSSFKSASALSTTVTTGGDKIAMPPKSTIGISGGNASVCNQLQATATDLLQESRSTGLRLEWKKNTTDNSILRRAQSQRESLITSGSSSCDLG